MSAEKTIAISFRVSEQFKQLLDAAALRENRSKTNLLETLLFAYCEANGIVATKPPTHPKKARAA